MRNDLQCPYCGVWMDVDYSRGQEECIIYDKDCPGCGKTFLYDITIYFSHNVWKAPCQNGGEHDWEFEHRHHSRMKCAVCGDTRELTEKEREENDV